MEFQVLLFEKRETEGCGFIEVRSVGFTLGVLAVISIVGVIGWYRARRI